MKRNFKLFTAIVLLFLVQGAKILATDDFTASVLETDTYQGYIIPLKRSVSHQLQVKLKNNNIDENCSVAINTSAFGEPGSWITIDDNSQSIAKSGNFLYYDRTK